MSFSNASSFPKTGFSFLSNIASICCRSDCVKLINRFYHKCTAEDSQTRLRCLYFLPERQTGQTATFGLYLLRRASSKLLRASSHLRTGATPDWFGPACGMFTGLLRPGKSHICTHARNKFLHVDLMTEPPVRGSGFQNGNVKDPIFRPGL